MGIIASVKRFGMGVKVAIRIRQVTPNAVFLRLKVIKICEEDYYGRFKE